MKQFILAFILATAAFRGFAQNGTLKLTITGIENRNGTVEIGVFDNKNSFPDEGKEFKGVSVKPQKKGNLVAVIKNIPAGFYGIAVWHDENGNKKMDKNLFGIPKEKYGFSKNIYGRFGPPDFDKIAVKVTPEQVVELTINLK